MGNQTDEKVIAANELKDAVIASERKQKIIKSKTFWKMFKVYSRQPQTVEEVKKLLDERDLKVELKPMHGKENEDVIFGKEPVDDYWIVISSIIKPPLPPPTCNKPSDKWFEDMQKKVFETEKEVVTYFIDPLRKELGYDEDDVVIGYKIKMFKGSRAVYTEADFVLFNGTERTPENALLVIEAKNSNNEITPDHIKEAQSYAKELIPAYYVVTNGRRTKVYQFNGLLAPDELVLDFEQSDLSSKWEELCRYISKDAAVERKEWMNRQSGFKV